MTRDEPENVGAKGGLPSEQREPSVPEGRWDRGSPYPGRQTRQKRVSSFVPQKPGKKAENDGDGEVQELAESL